MAFQEEMSCLAVNSSNHCGDCLLATCAPDCISAHVFSCKPATCVCTIKTKWMWWARNDIMSICKCVEGTLGFDLVCAHKKRSVCVD